MLSNPYLTIWTKPRATMEQVRPNPNRGLLLFCIINGLLLNINFAQTYALQGGMKWGWLLLLSIILSPITGYINLTVANFFVFITGKWLKGDASFRESRAALAWSSFPLIINVLIWFLLFSVVGEKLFTPPNQMLFTRPETFLLFGVSLVQVVFSVWSLIVYFNALAAMQGFSVLRAIGNVVIATILFLIIILILWVIVVLIGTKFV
ncbi:MAG TPA: Yip1 family protein [Chlamydiales bacterium]|nr:Yip1 family protein [Chlamydiales bacterium]